MYISPNNKLEDFKHGDTVRYVPQHAIDDFIDHGDHVHIEYGVVNSVGNKFVFVRYIRNNILQSTSAATDPKDLINDSK